MSENDKEIELPKSSEEKIPVPLLRRFVRIIVVDMRKGSTKRQFELEGMMEVPASVYFGQVKVNWHFDEFDAPMKGLALDVCAQGVNLLFPIMKPTDVLDAKTHSPVSYENIAQVFRKYHVGMTFTKDSTTIIQPKVS